MSLTIVKKTSTHNTTKKSRKIEYICIHYTAGVSSKKGSAISIANYFATTKNQASADFIVDDVDIVQYNPDINNYVCWAVGGSKYNTKGGSYYGKCTNSNSISIEICSSNKTGKVTNANDGNWYFSDAAINNAIELVKYLMKELKIDENHIIRHYDVNGKPCPGIVGWNKDTNDESKWFAFKKKLTTTTTTTNKEMYRIRKDWKDASSQIGAYSNLESAKKNCKEGYKVFNSKGEVVYSVEKKFKEYKVKVTAITLNVRSGPSIDNKVVQSIKKDEVYTIINEKNGWGQLKSKVGWIKLSYTKKV